MKNRHYAALLVVLSLWLAACGGGGNQNATVAVATPSPQPSPNSGRGSPAAAPSPTPAPTPTDTPVPPSATPPPPSAQPPIGTATPAPAADRFSVAGLTEKQASDFLQALQAAVAQDNRGQVADLVAFPLDITVGGATVTLPSKQEFIDSYAQIIDPQVKAAILGQTAAGLFVNDRGVMIGNGEVWFGGVGSAPPYQVKIIAVNSGMAPPPATPTPVRLSFEPGGTSVSVEGSIQAGGIADYVINAMAGQMMMVSIMSPNMNVYLTVYGVQDRQTLIRAMSGDTDLSAILPATQDYIIEVVSGGQASNYSLQVVIPARIEFAPGATSASVQGTVSGGAIVRYLLRAMAGQTMTVTITSPHQDVLLTIWGLTDGQPLVRSVSGATSWTGVLPATQDYVIDAVSVGGNTTYTVATTVK